MAVALHPTKVIRVLLDLEPLAADVIRAIAPKREVTFVDPGSQGFDVILTSPERARAYGGMPVVAVSYDGNRLEVNNAELGPAKIVQIIRTVIEQGGSPWTH